MARSTEQRAVVSEIEFMETAKKIKYKVVEKIIEAPGVATLLFAANPHLPEYCPGQFIDIYFPDASLGQGKSYSISGAPSENKFCITVRAIGEFSNRLFDMKIGGSVLGSEPYGFFWSDLPDTHLVMLAAGIGICPFRSMIAESLARNPNRKITLLYSNRTEEDMVFRKELDDWQERYPSFKAVYFLTREENIINGNVRGRITAEKVLSEIPGIKNTEFMISGSIAFVRDMRLGLKKFGVPEETIYTEAFFSH